MIEIVRIQEHGFPHSPIWVNPHHGVRRVGNRLPADYSREEQAGTE